MRESRKRMTAVVCPRSFLARLKPWNKDFPLTLLDLKLETMPRFHWCFLASSTVWWSGLLLTTFQPVEGAPSPFLSVQIELTRLRCRLAHYSLGAKAEEKRHRPMRPDLVDLGTELNPGGRNLVYFLGRGPTTEEFRVITPDWTSRVRVRRYLPGVGDFDGDLRRFKLVDEVLARHPGYFQKPDFLGAVTVKRSVKLRDDPRQSMTSYLDQLRRDGKTSLGELLQTLFALRRKALVESIHQEAAKKNISLGMRPKGEAKVGEPVTLWFGDLENSFVLSIENTEIHPLTFEMTVAGPG